MRSAKFILLLHRYWNTQNKLAMYRYTLVKCWKTKNKKSVKYVQFWLPNPPAPPVSVENSFILNPSLRVRSDQQYDANSQQPDLELWLVCCLSLVPPVLPNEIKLRKVLFEKLFTLSFIPCCFLSHSDIIIPGEIINFNIPLWSVNILRYQQCEVWGVRWVGESDQRQKTYWQ